MSQLSIFEVEFRLVKAAGQGQQGSAYVYTRPIRRATVSAASSHPKDILTVLNADIPVSAGETIEIVSVRSGTAPGSEGSQILA